MRLNQWLEISTKKKKERKGKEREEKKRKEKKEEKETKEKKRKKEKIITKTIDNLDETRISNFTQRIRTFGARGVMAGQSI